jgi:membrane-bound lytic murein transglycosylase D
MPAHLKRFACAGAALLLAACAGTRPPAETVEAPRPAELSFTAPPAHTIVTLPPHEVLQSQVANVDVTDTVPQDLWQRMRNGFAMPDLTTPAAQERTAWYAARPEYQKRSFERARPFLFHIVEEIERRGMPTELALLPLVESAYNPRAVSPALAAGMWQFIPSTGKRYNLTQDWWRDDRRDILASTNAALDYLQSLYDMFRDWHLALAAYNWGEGAVGRAIERAKARGEPTDYANLRMPAETAGYVPKLQAIKNLVARPEAYNLALPRVANEPAIATVVKTRDIDVKTAARLADMPVEEFMHLNPSHNRPVIPGANRPSIVLPAAKVETFRQNLAASEERPLSTWQAYLVKAGEKIEQIAARFRIDLSELKAINSIAPKARVAPGHTLIVPKDGRVAEIALPSKIDQPAVLAEERSVRKTYVVKKGDTLFAVARAHKVSVDDLKRWNRGVQSIAPGQKLAVETVVATAPPKQRSATVPAKKKAVAAKKGKRSVRVAKR